MPHDVTVDCKLLLVWQVINITALPIHAFTQATRRLLQPVQLQMPVTVTAICCIMPCLVSGAWTSAS